ncbi:MAG: hypothetical protein WAU07_02845 [Microgenomates group bacterium]
MAKQRMIVTDDQLLIDMDLLFNAIREADGDWEKVEADMQAYLDAIQNMVDDEDMDDEDQEDDIEVDVEEPAK